MNRFLGSFLTLFIGTDVNWIAIKNLLNPQVYPIWVFKIGEESSILESPWSQEDGGVPIWVFKIGEVLVTWNLGVHGPCFNSFLWITMMDDFFQ